MVRIVVKIERKKPKRQDFGKSREKKLFGRTLVKIRAKIEKNTLYIGALVRIVVKMEINPERQGFVENSIPDS